MTPDEAQQRHSALSCRGRRLYGRLPREGGERRALAFQALGQSLVLLPSPLHGYGVSTVLSRLPSDSVVMAVELEPDLNLLSVTSPESLLPALLTSYPEQLQYFHAPYTQQLLQEICRKIPTHIRRVRLLSLNNGYSLHAEAYRELQQGIEDEIARLWRNRATTLALGPLWVRNLFRNLPLLATMPRLYTPIKTANKFGRYTETSRTSASCTSANWPRGPVVVVGAGASLEADIDIIRNVRDQVTLVAADSALGPLKGHGITPDLVVVLEAQPVNREHFLFPENGQLVTEQEFPFTACDLSSLPSLARYFERTGGLFFITRFANISLFERIEQHGLVPATVMPVGSVGVCAIMLTTQIFSGPIGITGFDSAYSGGLPHTRGAASHRWALRRSTRLDQEPLFTFRYNRRPIAVTGKGERTYLTEPNLMGSAERIGELFDSCPRLFDFGSTGLKLGREVPSTKEAVRAALGISASLSDPKSLPAQNEQPASPHKSHGIPKEVVETARLCSFLETEITLLNAGIKELTELEAEDAEQTTPSAVAKLEYLYFDVSPTAPTSSAGRRRALLQAYRYKELLEHSLAVLSK